MQLTTINGLGRESSNAVGNRSKIALACSLFGLICTPSWYRLNSNLSCVVA